MKCASPNSADAPALLAHDAQDLAIEIELEHLAGMPMGKPERLVGSDEQAAGRAGMLPIPA